MQTIGATVVGRGHRRVGRGSQDAVVTVVHEGIAALAVADGCSQGRHSELGAGLGARFAAAQAVRRAAAGVPLAVIAQGVMHDWQAQLLLLADLLSPSADRSAAVGDALLATLWVCVAVGDQAIVFGVGDGVIAVDGAVQVIEQGAAPDYPAYALFPDLPPPRLQVPHHGAFSRIVIGTDGAAALAPELDAFATEARVQKNPSLLQKRLNLLRDSDRAPEDDCTLAVLTRGAVCA